mmetsp:Transcript_128999/g.412418  ORF Transcript_128999/g.412418 Transcript_128999/m.412418 type:complete len:106 (-) Transcript_128999:1107-1424(-)
MSTRQEIVLDAGRVHAKVLIAHHDYMESGAKQSGELMAAADELAISIVSLTPDDKVVGTFSMKHVRGPKCRCRRQAAGCSLVRRTRPCYYSRAAPAAPRSACRTR